MSDSCYFCYAWGNIRKRLFFLVSKMRLPIFFFMLVHFIWKNILLKILNIFRVLDLFGNIAIYINHSEVAGDIDPSVCLMYEDHTNKSFKQFLFRRLSVSNINTYSQGENSKSLSACSVNYWMTYINLCLQFIYLFIYCRLSFFSFSFICFETLLCSGNNFKLLYYYDELNLFTSN